MLVALFTITLFHTVSAQTNPVQITGGTISVPGDRQKSGSAELKSEMFLSTAILRNSPDLAWADVCTTDSSCKPGSTFLTPGLFDFYDLQSKGNFTINGTTYDAFYSKQLNFSRQTVVIPRIARKKGLVFFTVPFEVSGKMSVCQVSEFGSPCPSNKFLFSGDVQGHGTLRIVLRINFKYSVNKLETFYKLENFEYRFES